MPGRRVVAWIISCTLLALLVWLAITRTKPDAGDELIGALVYGSMLLSLLVDVVCILLPSSDSHQTAWHITSAEIALRLATVALLMIGILTFLPAPGYQIDFPLLFAGSVIALAYVLEAPWRIR